MIAPETIQAYVDGELDPAARAEIEAAVASDEIVRAAVERERALRARISGRFDPVLEEPVPAGLSALLTAEPTNIVSFAAARERRGARWGWPQGMAIAASLTIGLVLGQTAFSGTDGIATRDGVAIASGDIAAALDTQLASAHTKDAAVRIGVSFRTSGGQLCRSFTATATAGIACRTDESWRIEALRSRAQEGPAGEYRQAGSSEAAILAEAQSMMAGEPFDAAAERAARDGGWTVSR